MSRVPGAVLGVPGAVLRVPETGLGVPGAALGFRGAVLRVPKTGLGVPGAVAAVLGVSRVVLEEWPSCGGGGLLGADPDALAFLREFNSKSRLSAKQKDYI